jgi:hypothetical protein
MMKPSEILKAAKAVIADPNKWCQGRMAKNQFGEWAAYESSDAVQFCAIGALQLTLMGQPYHEGDLARAHLGTAASPTHPALVNDNEGYEATLAMYDRAILAAETEEADT